MGNWNISIEGVGCHHNTDPEGKPNLPSDANRMALAFVEQLKSAGHSVTKASITYGGADNLLNPQHYAYGVDINKEP